MLEGRRLVQIRQKRVKMKWCTGPHLKNSTAGSLASFPLLQYCGMSNTTETNLPIPVTLWRAAAIIALQSLSFGYVFSCLNACLVTGDNNDGSDCYHGIDKTCPPGSIYNNINLSLGKKYSTMQLNFTCSFNLSCFFSGSTSRHFTDNSWSLGRKYDIQWTVWAVWDACNSSVECCLLRRWVCHDCIWERTCPLHWPPRLRLVHQPAVHSRTTRM